MGWTASADRSVDWNRDGAISTAPYPLVLRADVEGAPACQTLLDWDDASLLAAKMGASIPAGLGPRGASAASRLGPSQCAE